MTVQWVLIASFLYFELGLIVLLALPFISPKIWRGIFHFHVWKTIVKKANMYFNTLIFVLILFFLDSIRDMVKYSSKHSYGEFDAELQMNVKLFRSQRNYYISGFAVFLWLVIRRLVILILDEAELIAQVEESAKKAQEATENLQKMQKLAKLTDRPVNTDESRKECESLQEKFDLMTKKVASVNQEISHFKENAFNVQQEYEKLLKLNKDLKGAVSNGS